LFHADYAENAPATTPVTPIRIGTSLEGFTQGSDVDVADCFVKLLLSRTLCNAWLRTQMSRKHEDGNSRGKQGDRNEPRDPSAAPQERRANRKGCECSHSADSSCANPGKTETNCELRTIDSFYDIRGVIPTKLGRMCQSVSDD